MTVIRVGAQPEALDARGDYLDGVTAAVRPAALRIDETAQMLIIAPEGKMEVRWPLAEVCAAPDQSGGARQVLRRRGGAARLLTDDPVVAVRCPNLTRSERAPGGMRLLAWAAAAIASVALILFVLMPFAADRLAVLVPPEGERALGQATLAQVRRAFGGQGGALAVCDGAEGQAVLDSLAADLAEGGGGTLTLDVMVLDSPIVNAFALPGGIVVLMRGLIDKAGGPDEVAAVLAHEVGHVAARDPVRSALRVAGSAGVLGLLIGDFAGGTVVLVLAEQAISARHSQEAEAAADAFAVGALERIEADPSALARFFRRLQEGGGEMPDFAGHFLPHPALMDRIAAAEAAGGEGGTSVLDEAEWQAVQAICE